MPSRIGGGGNGGYRYPAPQLALSAGPNGGSGGGGGGDPGNNDNPWRDGGSGGSGRIQIRYSDYYDALTTVTGSPDVYTSGDGFRVYDFKGSGSFTI
jgi:hypothetical protein